MKVIIRALMLILLVFACLPKTASAQALSEKAYLKKLSVHIRGEKPTREEYIALAEAISTNRTQEFINAKIAEYFKHSGHIARVQNDLNELFRVAPSALSDGSYVYNGVGNYELIGNHDYRIEIMMSGLFRSMAVNNRPWDELLLSKQVYGLMPKDLDRYLSNGLSPSDKQILLAQMKEHSQTYGYEDFPGATFNDSPNISGVFSVNSFYERYRNTVVNKGRTRAAAVFRIFLCDDMVPIVFSNEENDRKRIQQTLDIQSGMNIQQSQAPSQGGNSDPHGAQKDCAACHYKLDPLGKSFFNISSSFFPAKTIPGNLRFRNSKGNLVDEPFTNFSELGQAIAKQDDYAMCQVEHFWEWYIGTDVPLSKERKAELAKEFNRVGRRTNDFISLLVQTPEFKIPPLKDTKTDLRLAANQVLKNCNDCHTSMGLPDFTAFPIGGSAESHTNYISKISKALDIENNGQNRIMPPDYSSWQPTAQDLQILKSWINDRTSK